MDKSLWLTFWATLYISLMQLVFHSSCVWTVNVDEALMALKYAYSAIVDL